MASIYQSGNPALQGNVFDDWSRTDRRSSVMTIQGTALKSILLLAILTATASFAWSKMGEASLMGPLFIGGLIGSLIFYFATVFKKEWSAITAPGYAACEGLLLGGLSGLVNQRYPGIATQAVGLSFGVMFIMLFLYGTRIIRVTAKLTMGIVAATGAVALLYLVSMVMRMFGGAGVGFIYSATPIGIGFSVFVVGLAAFNLLLDFDIIERGARSEAPKYMEWYGGFALMVTMVWLYLEILRLLMKLQSRRD